MSIWQNYTIEERQVILQKVSQYEQLPQPAIEKDWWVTLVLKALFMTEAAPALLFKGGTSLSKGWHLIDRLSEDVDVAIDHSFFGINGTNKNQREKLRKLSRHYLHNTLSQQLDTNLQTLGVTHYRIENITTTETGTPIDSDKDPTVIFVWYDSICPEQIEYIPPRVKIEISCLSMSEPSEVKDITSLISNHYPDIDDQATAKIKTVLPTRTFLEKVFLLHEEFQKENPRHLRMSRHLYDLYKLMHTDWSRNALADPALYSEIVQHRALYYALKYVDYTSHHPSSINFCPPQAVLGDWRRDYDSMIESFIYGEYPTFEGLIIAMDELMQEFREIEGVVL